MKALNFKVPEEEAAHFKEVAESRKKTMTSLLRTWMASLRVKK